LGIISEKTKRLIDVSIERPKGGCKVVLWWRGMELIGRIPSLAN